jgi:hypothetical protein
MSAKDSSTWLILKPLRQRIEILPSIRATSMINRCGHSDKQIEATQHHSPEIV